MFEVLQCWCNNPHRHCRAGRLALGEIRSPHDMLDNVESFVSEATAPSEPENDTCASKAEAAREAGGRNPRPSERTSALTTKARRAGPWPHENPRGRARTPHKALRLPPPVLQPTSRAGGPMPHRGPWFKGQGATAHKDHHHPWPAGGQAPQSQKKLRPTGLPRVQNTGLPRWVSSPRCACSANGTPIREPTPCAAAPRWGKRSEQNRADREAELPNATSPAADDEFIRAKEQGMSIAEAELPPGYPFHVRTTLPREPCASAPVATNVALPPIVPHTSGGDAVKSGGPVPGGVVRRELVYMRDSTRGIVVVRW